LPCHYYLILIAAYKTAIVEYKHTMVIASKYIAFIGTALSTDRDIYITADDMPLAKAGVRALDDDIAINNKGGCTAFRPFFLIS